VNSLLLPYQRRWIADQSPVKVYEKSRRIGITWAEAADAVLDAASQQGADWWYIGYNREMALEFIEAAAEWVRYFQGAATAIEQMVVEDEDNDILAYRIRFSSGHKIVALSSRPANLRGKQGVAIIDEAAFHDDLGELLKAALALTIWGGRLHIISTHNGATNPFNQLVDDIRAGRKPYSLHRTTFDDALAQGLYRAICRVRHKTWTAEDEQAWRSEILTEYGDNADEELFCIPSATSGIFIPSALVEARMRADIPVVRWHCRSQVSAQDAQDWIHSELAPVMGRLDPSLMSCFGEDFGRSGDLTVIWPLQIRADLVRTTPFLIELRNVPFRQQEQILFHVVDRLPRFIGGAMDARGNGQYLAEQAVLRYGSCVEAVMLSIEWYREHMPRYKAAFEDGKLELPRDADVLADHKLLRMQQGVARLDERRIQAEHGQRHGDTAIAGALAWYASSADHREYAYIPASQTRLRDSDGDRFTFGSRLRFRPGSW
jgi:phage FluMu gp28-like protein